MVPSQCKRKDKFPEKLLVSGSKPIPLKQRFCPGGQRWDIGIQAVQENVGVGASFKEVFPRRATCLWAADFP